MNNSERFLHWVVKYYTAVEIFRNHPDFKRLISEIEPVKNVSNQRYISRDAKQRQFFDAIFIF